MLKKQGLICIKTLSASGSVSVKRFVHSTQFRSLTLVSPAKERIDSGSKWIEIRSRKMMASPG